MINDFDNGAGDGGDNGACDDVDNGTGDDVDNGAGLGVDNGAGDGGDNAVDNGAGDETWGMSSRTSGRSMVERGDGDEPAAPGVVVVVVAVVVDRNPGEHVEDDKFGFTNKFYDLRNIMSVCFLLQILLLLMSISLLHIY